jgi:heptosyltransferase-2
MYPYQTPFVAIENKEIGCRPCSKIGFEKCPLGHFKCVNELEFSDLEKKYLKQIIHHEKGKYWFGADVML